MTNEELIEGVARAIQESTKEKVAEHYGHPTYFCEETNKIIEDKTKPEQLLSETYRQIDWDVAQQIAQAVINHLPPMMREVVGAIQEFMPFETVKGDCFQRTNPHTKLMGNSNMAWAVSNGNRSAHKVREQIFTLSEALSALPECWLQQVQSYT